MPSSYLGSRFDDYQNAADVPKQLRAMWALHCLGFLKPEDFIRSLNDKNEYIRAWGSAALMRSEGSANRCD